MSKLINAIWVEKYRPKEFKDLIFKHKEALIKNLKDKKAIPSFIFYSNSPGTGKTSTAKIIEMHLDLDMIKLNASDDRGIDNIREIKTFASSLSFNPDSKRCVFLDEADGLTGPAQDAMKVLMEDYSENCFFILSCNDISKISEPIQSRCVAYNFSDVDSKEVLARLVEINKREKVDLSDDELNEIMNISLPDIRKAIKIMQGVKRTGTKDFGSDSYKELLVAINNQDTNTLYQKILGEKNFDINGFVRYFIYKLYKTPGIYLEKRSSIALLLADVSKAWTIKADAEVVLLANLTEIMRIMHVK